MRQTGSAKAYADRFRSAILDVPGMTEDWRLDAFIRGLKPNVRRELERYPAVSLSEAIRVAERIDSIDFKFSRGAAGEYQPEAEQLWERQTAKEPQREGPVPMELGALRQGGQRGAAAQQPKRCFNCDQPGHFSAQCQQQRCCFKCRQPGHFSAQCPQRRNNTNRRQ